MFKRGVFLFVAGMAAILSARAGVITNVTINSVSSEYVSGTDQRRATNLVNGSGLYGDVHTAIPQGSMWLSNPNPLNAASVSQQFVVFDLGAVHTVNAMKVWNYNEQVSGANILTRRGVAVADISVAGEDQVFTTNKANVAIRRATGTFTNFFDVIDMGGVSARYVRISVQTNYLEAGDYRVGLSKVLFLDNSTAPVVKSANRSFSGDRVTIRFGESMDAATATNKANYTVLGEAPGTVAIASTDWHVYDDAVDLKFSPPLTTNGIYTVTINGVKDIAGASTVSGVTVKIGTDMVTWLKADAGVVADGSGLVSEWEDQSGNTNNAVQLDPAAQPTLVANAVTNKPAVHFDGATQFMDVPFNDSLTADRDVTLYIVVSLDLANTLQFQTLMGINNNNIPASYDWYINRGNPLGSPRFTFLRGNGSANQSFLSPVSSIEAGKFYVVSVVQRGTAATTYLNGSFNGSGTFTVGQLTIANSIRLGMRHDGGTKLQGSIAEALVFKGAVSDAERAAIDDYLGKKYGINVVALQITQQPAGVTIESGQTALFSVSAVSGSPTLNYQWKSNGVNVVGATNSFYKTPFLTTTANGANYSVVVSTPLGTSLTSSNATVVVNADVTAPTVASATLSTNGTNIIVTFSEPVTSASGTDTTHYSLSGGASVTAAAMGSVANQVILTASGLSTNTALLTVHDVADAAAHLNTTITLPVLSPSLALWVRADAGVRLESGAVRQWLDQGPYGNDALQLNATRRPTLNPASMNGQPALSFDGTQYIEAFSTPSLSFPADTTVFAVLNAADYAGFRGIIGKTLGNQPGPIDFYLVQGTGIPRFYRGNGVGQNAQSSGSSAVPAGEPHEISVVMQSTNVTHFLDGAPNGGSVLATTIADAGTPLKIGNRDDLAVPFKGDIAEIMVFNGAISASERRAIDTYLGIKYFPFSIVDQPQSATKLQGQTATFSVNAKAGGAAFNYQWQRNNIDIPGATSSTYTTPILTLSNNTDTYRVVISAPGMAPVTSDSATLTVNQDLEAPTIVSVGRQIWNPSQIVVVFSEPVDPSTATNKLNYTISNGATVTAAAFGSSSNQVVLTTTGLTPGSAFDVTVQNVKDLFNNTVVTVTNPLGIYPASLALWLRADVGVVRDGTGQVTTWTDQSGNNNNAIVLAPENAPTYTTNVWDNLPALNFDGSTDFLVVPSSISLSLLGDMSVYVVAQFTGYTGGPPAIALIGKTGGTAGNIAAPYDYYVSTAGLPNLLRGNGTTYGAVAGTNVPSLNAAHVLSVVQSGTAVNHYLDTQSNGSGVITAPIDDGGSDVGIGTRQDLVTKMFGDMQEMLVFGAALSDADRAAIDAYLTNKYKAAAPTEVRLAAALSGNNLSLSWDASATGFVLQSNANIGNSAGWTEVTSPVVTANGKNTVTVPVGAGNLFFRLFKP